jgi:hypothetical protein
MCHCPAIKVRILHRIETSSTTSITPEFLSELEPESVEEIEDGRGFPLDSGLELPSSSGEGIGYVQIAERNKIRNQRYKHRQDMNDYRHQNRKLKQKWSKCQHDHSFL